VTIARWSCAVDAGPFSRTFGRRALGFATPQSKLGATFEVDEASRKSQPNQSYLHVYVPDTDALYTRAVAAGAKGVKPPYTAPYGDRAATITDPFGNTWFLATYLGTTQP
jgi:uncharacterized glyoxalase superfamily protein PhnB